MNYIELLYLLGLLFFAANQNKISNRSSFRSAWWWFAAIPLSHFFLTFFKAKNHNDIQDLNLIAIWQDGLAGLALCISLNYLLSALIPAEDDINESAKGR